VKIPNSYFLIPNSKLVLAKYLRRERGDDRVRVAPAAGLDPCFATGVIEKGLPVPAKLHCHLRQEEAARHAPFEQDPIPADDHVVEFDAPEGCESGDLDMGVEQFVRPHRFKTGVLKGGGDGVVPDRLPQRRDADHMTDTTSEPTVDLEGHEGAARFEEKLVVRLWRGKGFSIQATLDRFACEREQKAGRVTVDGGLGGTGNHLYQDGIVTR